MAQLKDLIVAGSSRFIGDVYANKLQLTSLSIPTSAGGNEYTTGTNKYIIQTNGTSIFWNSPSNIVNDLDSANHKWVRVAGDTMTGPLHVSNTGKLIFDYTGSSDAAMFVLNNAENYGIRYKEGNPDTMKFSASGNANSDTGADLCINAHGDGTLATRNNRIPHTGNTTGTVGSTTQPVYINAGTITSTTYALKATVNNATQYGVTYYSTTTNLTSTAAGTTSQFLGGAGSAAPTWRDASYIINTLTTGSSDPQDADYYVAQYAGGGTSTTTYHRRSHSALWNYINSKITSNRITTATQYGVAYYSSTTKITSTAAGTSGYLLQGNGSAAPSWIQATNANTASTIVKRDASGNFSAGTITASLSGNASTATTATALSSNAGSILNPVYFSGGKPVAASGNAIPFITGTGSTAGTWEGALTGLTAYYDGLLILYKPSVAGASTTTLNINSLGAKTVYLNGTTKLTTHYPASQPILLVYSTSQNSGCWEAIDNYDSNTTPYGIRVYRQNAGYNGDYPLLISRTAAGSIGTAGTNDSYTNNIYGVIWDTTTIAPTLNPSTGLMKVPGGITANITGNVTGNVSGSSGSCTGNAATATKLAASKTINGTAFDGSGNITTTKWGTARNITISDSDGTNTGAAVSVDGSGAVTLKLPSTIKASLTGNASTATSATSASNASNATKVTLTNATSTTAINIVGTNASTAGASKDLYFNTGVTVTTGNVLKGAAWNDYAEYRQTKEQIEAGRVIQENGDDTLRLADGRLLPGCEIVSDTFGFAIGETEHCGTPVAATGRVLAYPYEDRELFRSYIGSPVCSGPNGTVSIMTEEEEMKYPSRIIGTISAVPDYEEWGTGNVKVNGRVWIRIR